ncbi:MAG: T9SS type A sorting domain-containing protein [Bacteroidia bacterium]|nr:T9SS type A sorting domain-containing protein [Bacteroidia bacterium]
MNCNAMGFEDYYTLPPYVHILDNWQPLESPDFLRSVCTNTYIGAPVNVFGYCQAKDGNNYVGLTPFQVQSDLKEYIYQHLSSPLVAGKVYCLSFYVSRADRNQYAVHSIGAYFSVNPQTTGAIGYVNKIPQIVNQTGFITDTIGWTQIQGCFTAVGGEQYMTIGNFNKNANTDTLFVGTNNPDPNYPGSNLYYSYYFIDDITLIDQATVGIKDVNNGNSFEIYPNPTTGLIKFSDERYSHGEYTFKILDLFGKEIVSEVLKEEIDISYFDKGIYTLLLYKNKQLVVTKKVMKN